MAKKEKEIIEITLPDGTVERGYYNNQGIWVVVVD